MQARVRPLLSLLSFCAAPFIVFAMGAPALLSPPSDAALIVPQPSFRWSAVPGATAYRIQIASSANFAEVLRDEIVEIPRFVPLEPLPTRMVHWRVRALFASGDGEWSAAFALALAEPERVYEVPPTATLVEIQAVLDLARVNRPATVRFAEGAAYTLHATANAALVLDGAEDLIIDCNDALFVLTNPSKGFIEIKNSRRIVLRRAKVDYDPLPHFVGAVESKSGGTLSLRREPGYPALNAPHLLANWSWGAALDSARRGWLKRGVANLFNFNVASVRADAGDPDLFSVSLATAANANSFEAGDRVIIFARANTQPLCAVRTSTDITFDRVVSYAAPQGHYVITPAGSSDVKVLSCESRPRDASRWFAGNADGVHANALLVGPWVENCVFSGLGDDAIALYSKGQPIQQKLDDATLRLPVGANFQFGVGDRFCVFNPREALLVGAPVFTVTALTIAGGYAQLSFTPALPESLQLGNADATRDDQVFDLTRCNADFVIRRNTFDGVRRFGSVLRATSGVVRSNIYRGISCAPIMLRNEARSSANGLASEDVLIADNTIEDSGFDSSALGVGDITVRLFDVADAPAMSLASRLHRGLTIRGNSIRNWNQHAIVVHAATDVLVEDNVISADTEGFTLPGENIPLKIENSERVFVRGNHLAFDRRSLADRIVVAANNTDVIVAGNVLPPAPRPSAVLDNASASGVTVVGAWSTTTLAGSYAGNALYTVGSPGRQVRFAPVLPVSGYYEVSLQWCAHTNRATNTRVDVEHTSGVETVYVDQTLNGGQWNVIGTFPCAASGPTSVIIRSDGANGNVVADAVRWRWVAALPGQSFIAWAAAQGFPFPAAGDALADPDGDGWSNLTEYAFDGDPQTGMSPAGAPTVGAARSIRFLHRAGSDVRYEVQFSRDLVNWETRWSTSDGWWNAAVESHEFGERFDSVSILAPEDALQSNAFFWRVAISREF